MFELFSVDVSRSGEGELEMIVECNGETIPSEMKETERGWIEAFFIPRKSGVHKINMMFNGENVPGTFICKQKLWFHKYS